MTYPITRFKRVLSRNDGGVWGDEPSGFDDSVVLRSTDQSVDGHWLNVEPALRSLSPTDRAKARLLEGDLLLTKSSGSAMHIGKTTCVTRAIAESRPAFSNFMQRLRLSPSNLPEFYWYCLRSDFVRDQLNLASTTTTGLSNLNASILGELEVPHPLPEEQRKITDYLDTQTTKIEKLITKQQQLVGTLAERRQAVISHAVTKGLDPIAETKDSGLKWYGKVPQGWTVGPLKWALLFLTSGSRGWSEFYSDEGTPFIRIGNLTRGSLQFDMADTQHVRIPFGAEGSRAVVREGDVLFSITAYLGSVAVASAANEGSFVSQHVALARLRETQILPHFLGYLTLSEPGQRQLNEGAYGGTKIQLSLEDVKNLQVTFPPLDQQRAIIKHLDRETSQIDALSKKAQETIGVLKERRQALISAAVTGKIDVRGLA